MKYADFRHSVAKYPFFRSNIFPHLTGEVPILRRQISEWLQKKLLVELKRGMYMLAESEKRVEFSSFFLANHLYSPSYISLETALSYYSLIPEYVPAITSVSSKKTQAFTNPLGKFIYKHVKPALYGGFVAAKDEYGNTFSIATPERALIDYLYLKLRGVKKIHADIFEAGLRLQNTELLDANKLRKFAKPFKQKKLNTMVEMLIKTIR